MKTLDKSTVSHHEEIGTAPLDPDIHNDEADNDHTLDVEAKNLPPALVDAETAKYLDSSVVIDEKTNRRIKRMVSACDSKHGWAAIGLIFSWLL